MFRAMPLLLKLFGRVPTGRASADYAALQNILRMVPLRVLRIPRAYFSKFYVLKSASMVLALKNMLHPKKQKLVGGMRCLSRSALHATHQLLYFRMQHVF